MYKGSWDTEAPYTFCTHLWSPPERLGSNLIWLHISCALQSRSIRNHINIYEDTWWSQPSLAYVDILAFYYTAIHWVFPSISYIMKEKQFPKRKLNNECILPWLWQIPLTFSSWNYSLKKNWVLGHCLFMLLLMKPKAYAITKCPNWEQFLQSRLGNAHNHHR